MFCVLDVNTTYTANNVKEPALKKRRYRCIPRTNPTLQVTIRDKVRPKRHPEFRPKFALLESSLRAERSNPVQLTLALDCFVASLLVGDDVVQSRAC